jgi:hypothetical protein
MAEACRAEPTVQDNKNWIVIYEQFQLLISKAVGCVDQLSAGCYGGCGRATPIEWDRAVNRHHKFVALPLRIHPVEGAELRSVGMTWRPFATAIRSQKSWVSAKVGGPARQASTRVLLKYYIMDIIRPFPVAAFGKNTRPRHSILFVQQA